MSAKRHSPRHGSLQFWPRKRAKNEIPRVRNWTEAQGILGFAGYKVGMTHILVLDERKNSPNKNKQVALPVTVLECPPLKIFGVRVYKNDYFGARVVKEIWKPTEKLALRLRLPKKDVSQKAMEDLNKLGNELSKYSFIRLLVHTQPYLTGIGKKMPEIFELAIGGNIEEQYSIAKNYFGKEIRVSDVFKQGELVDIHGVTKGKGFVGPVKRFGISLKHHKSEKGVRRPGSLGSWIGTMRTVPMAGQMGYFLRTEYNKWLLAIMQDPSQINPSGGFKHYGVVRNDYVLIKGSVPGPAKRLIKITKSIRPNKKLWQGEAKILYVHK